MLPLDLLLAFNLLWRCFATPLMFIILLTTCDDLLIRIQHDDFALRLINSLQVHNASNVDCLHLNSFLFSEFGWSMLTSHLMLSAVLKSRHSSVILGFLHYLVGVINSRCFQMTLLAQDLAVVDPFRMSLRYLLFSLCLLKCW